MADLHHLGRAEGRRARRGAARAVRPGRRGAASPAATYSGGMRRRLDLAMTLVGDPRIIFLDEPTTGLDPRSRRTMWEIIRELVAGGVTIFLTTQYLEEADRARRPDRGARPRHGSSPRAPPDELKRLVPGGHIRLRFADPGELDAAAARARRRRPRRRGADARRCPSDGGVASLRALLDRLDAECDRRRRPDRPHPRPRRRLPRPHRELSHHDRLRHSRTRRRCCAATCGARCATPSLTAVDRRHADRLPAAVRLRLRRHARRRPAGVSGGRGDYLDYVDARASSLLAVAGARPGHGDLGRHGHDRGDHRPLPHHGDRPRLGAHRPRRRQPDPDDARDRGRDRRRAARSGFGPTAGPLEWLAAIGLLALVTFARDLAGRRARAGHQERRDREQPADAADPPAVPRQRVRPDRLDAGRRCAGSPRTSPSRRSWRPCAGC